MDHESPRKRRLKRAGAFVAAAVAALIVWVAVDAQLDYANRERTNEGLFAAVEVKKGITAFQRANGRLPGAQEAAQFRHEGKLEHAASVAWDASRKAVVVTMGPRFDGKRFEYAAPETAGAQDWSCRSIDLDPKYLRNSCR